MEKNKELKEIFKVSSSQKWYKFIIYALVLVLPGLSFFILFIYIPPINLSLTFSFAFVGLLLPPFIYIIFIWYKDWKRKSKLVVTNFKIEFYWLNFLFLQINWADIKTIKIFGERWKYPSHSARIPPIIYSGFTLQFIGPNLNKTVRLWCFPYKYKKQGMIISRLLQFCEKLDKEIDIDESEREIIIVKPDKILCPEFQNFYDKQKNLQSNKSNL